MHPTDYQLPDDWAQATTALLISLGASPRGADYRMAKEHALVATLHQENLTPEQAAPLIFEAFDGPTFILRLTRTQEVVSVRLSTLRNRPNHYDRVRELCAKGDIPALCRLAAEDAPFEVIYVPSHSAIQPAKPACQLPADARTVFTILPGAVMFSHPLPA